MRTRLIITVIFAVLACLGSGCSRLQSPHVVGEPVVYDNEYLGVEADFIVGEDIMSIKVMDKTRLRASWTYWDNESESFQLKNADIVISVVGDLLLLANIREDADENYSVYRLAHVIGVDEESLFKAVAFTIDNDVLSQLEAIETNPLSENGSSEEVSFIFTGSKEETDAFMAVHGKEIFDHSYGAEVTQLSGSNFLGESL